jgi:hypothetical protein
MPLAIPGYHVVRNSSALPVGLTAFDAATDRRRHRWKPRERGTISRLILTGGVAETSSSCIKLAPQFLPCWLETGAANR